MGALSSPLMQVKDIAGGIGGIAGLAGGLINDVSRFGESDAGRRSEQLRREQQLALKQLRQQQDAQARSLNEQAAADRAAVSSGAATEERRRLAALRRAVARQRAQFGGGGLSSADPGSTQAVLLGLFEESDRDRQERERIDSVRNAVIDRNLDTQKRLNVLQLNQLRERQKFERETAGF